MIKEKLQSELPIIEELKKFGWKEVDSKEVKGKEWVINEEKFRQILKKLNPDVEEKYINRLINEIKNLPSTLDGAYRFFNYLVNGYEYRDEKTGTIKRIKLINFDNIQNNVFLLANQIDYGTIRPDIVLFINYIPIVIIETKRLSINEEEAKNQIIRYSKEFPELFRYLQIGVASGLYPHYFPVYPNMNNTRMYLWKDEMYNESIEFLKPEILLDIIENFILFRFGKYGVSEKIVPRYMQYYAVKKAVERAINYILGKNDKHKGLIWHWQGSGKTLEMIYIARYLTKHLPKITKGKHSPTIFFVVDRIDLQAQLSSELNSLKIRYEVIENISHLKEVLTHGRDGKRGIFVVLIHKFREEDFKEFLNKELPISKRRDVILLVDEAHRTQYGKLAGVLYNLLKNAVRFGFTGTPLALRDRNTYIQFAHPETGEMYLHKYTIVHSIRDGFTLKISYQPRLEELHLDRISKNIIKEAEEIHEAYRKYLESEAEEIEEIERGETKVSPEIKRKILNIKKLILENPKIIEKKAKDIIKHYIKVTYPFKAMIVAGSRLACVRYKKIIDEILSNEEELKEILGEDYEKYKDILKPDDVEIVMTFNQNDPDEIREYYKIWKEKYGKGKKDEEIRQQIVERFKNENSPKILIVTDMLLTGFDAPILKTMYLDKLMKGHRLLQAITRTNRPYETKDIKKDAGLVIDYVGIFRYLKKALAIYSEEDAKAITQEALESYEQSLEEVKKLIKDLRSLLGEKFEIWFGKETPTREDIPEILDVLKGDKAKEFMEKYKILRSKYLTLKPEDKIKFSKFIKFYEEVYRVLRKTIFREKREIIDDISREILNRIYESTKVEIKNIELPIIELNEKVVEELIKNPKETYAIEITLMLYRKVVEGEIYDENLVSAVKRIFKKWQESKRKLIEELQEVIEIAKRYIEIEKTSKEKGLSRVEAEISSALNDYIKDLNKSISLAKDLYDNLHKKYFKNNKEWYKSKDLKRKIKAEILKYLLNKKVKNIKEVANRLLKLLENYYKNV